MLPKTSDKTGVSRGSRRYGGLPISVGSKTVVLGYRLFKRDGKLWGTGRRSARRVYSARVWVCRTKTPELTSQKNGQDEAVV